MLYYFKSMKFLNLQKKAAKKKEIIIDLYQNSIDKMGRAQIKEMINIGMSMPVVML